MTLISQINSLASAIATDVKSLTNSVSGKQASSANLTALSGLSGAADKTNYFTALGAMALADFTALGRSVVAAGNAAAARLVLDVYSKSESQALVNAGSMMGKATIKGASNVVTTVPANTVIGGAAGRIPGLAVTVTGEGRQVIISLTIPSYRHTATSTNIGISVGTTSLQMTTAKSPGNTAPGMMIDFEASSDVLTTGVQYTFYAYGRQATALAGAIDSQNDYPSEIRVQRA